MTVKKKKVEIISSVSDLILSIVKYFLNLLFMCYQAEECEFNEKIIFHFDLFSKLTRVIGQIKNEKLSFLFLLLSIVALLFIVNVFSQVLHQIIIALIMTIK